jgi:hypothetical protein
LIVPAAAQNPTVRIRGKIEAFSGTELTVAAREGAQQRITVPEGARLTAVVRASLADIKAGTFIGTAAMPTSGSDLRAIEVVVFPEAMRGTGEGHRPWDLLPESTMTNATVANRIDKVDGHTLTLAYKDGEKSVVVPPDAPIVSLAPATRADLKLGAGVVVNVTKGEGGALTAVSVTMGREGVDPPM